MFKRPVPVALIIAVMLASAAAASTEIVMRDLSMDRPLVLDENANYHLANVTVAGLSDCAALTLAGRINSIILERCAFGRVYAGGDGKAAALECAGAVVGKLSASNTSFFDAENQLACLKDGAFGKVSFDHCRFSTSDEFLKRIYAESPWRISPPVTEFYNIDRLELLDNEFVNTTVVIHPSVKQVVLRGEIPGLRIVSHEHTQVVRLNPGQKPDSVAMPPIDVVARK